MDGAFLFPPVLGRTIPYSTYAAGAVFLRDLQPVFSVNVLDTNNTPTTTGFESFFDNGATVFIEGTLPTSLFDRPGHLFLGGAYSSGEYFALDPDPYLIIEAIQGQAVQLPRKDGTWGLIAGFDQAICVSDEDPTRSWGVFASAGISDGNPNPIRWSADVGVGGASPIRDRVLDSFGVGYFYLGVSVDLKTVGQTLLPLRDEHGIELFYKVGATPWFHITPDL